VKSRLTLKADHNTTLEYVASGINTKKLCPIVLRSTAIGDEEKRQLCETMQSKYCKKWLYDCAVWNRSRAAVVQSEPTALTVAKELDKVLPEVYRRVHLCQTESAAVIPTTTTTARRPTARVPTPTPAKIARTTPPHWRWFVL